ncbi:MAG TPA: amidohydrolase family protein [Candidatus Binatia bacterium]
MKADLVIRGGTIVDGSGRPAYVADVVVSGDRIAAIGKHDGPAHEVIDARGKVVTPGFVDVHTHLDAQITWDPLGSPSNLHGVTSAIVGNCGVGFAPCKPQDRDYLMFLMEGVEDVPRAAMKEGIAWRWETFPEYLEHLASSRLGINVGAHLSHAPLRIWAMGEKGATDAPASDEELALMHRAIVDAMRAGALGFASGRTTMHRTPAWDPVPGTFADRRELDAIGRALAEVGTGVFELVPYGAAGEDANGFDRDYEWMVPVALASARPMSFGLIQNLAYPEVWRDVLAKVERAVAQGARLVPQVAVRSVGILMGFGTSISPLTMFPAGFDLIAEPIEKQREALRDPAMQAKLLESIRGTSGDILGGMATLRHVFPLVGDGVKAYETAPERSVVGIAERTGKEVGQVILDHILATDLRGFFIVPLYNPDLDAAAEMLRHPLTGIGLGDSGAHTSQTCDASFTTFLLAYWVRERKLLGLEEAVRKLTFDPALMWGLHGRGLIRRGAYADLNVIDLDRLDVELPVVKHEFPASAPHLSQDARGYEATIVNGRVLMRGGEHTGELPGRLLRNELFEA